MDLSILKDLDAADAEFDVGNIADFTLTLRGSEYMYSSDIIVTDTLPNGLCPLREATTAFTNNTGLPFPAECDALGTVTGAEMQSVTANLDGTFTVVFRPTSATYPTPGTFVLDPNETHDITYEALNRSAYKDATSEYGPTTSGDSFGNTVEFTAVTDAISPLLGWFPETLQVWDDSGASIASDFTTIDKTVMARADVEQGLAPGVDPCTLGTFSDTLETGFRMGDTVCFNLNVTFPTSIDVRNPVITDYLPRGMTYAGYAVIAGSVGPIIPTTLDASGGRLEWKVGTTGSGGDLYVPRGSTFNAHVWATIDGPSSGPILDKPQNLMKYRQQNVDGDALLPPRPGGDRDRPRDGAGQGRRVGHGERERDPRILARRDVPGGPGRLGLRVRPRRSPRSRGRTGPLSRRPHDDAVRGNGRDHLGRAPRRVHQGRRLVDHGFRRRLRPGRRRLPRGTWTPRSTRAPSSCGPASTSRTTPA